MCRIRGPLPRQARTRDVASEMRGRYFRRFLLSTFDLEHLVRIRFSLLLVVAAGLAACGDSTGLGIWDATPDTVTLFSASRTDLLGHASGYDFVNLTVVRVENPGAADTWDVLLSGNAAGPLQLVPASAFVGQTSRAGIATISGQTFDGLTSAPSDTSAFISQPVAIQSGGIYVVRTRRYSCSFSTAVNYAKVKAVAVDPVAGTARFAVVRNPNCNDRSFVPPAN